MENKTNNDYIITVNDVIIKENEINIEKCIQLWDKSLWFISQTKNKQYFLVKIYSYINSDNETVTKHSNCIISKLQANELIEKLGLTYEKTPYSLGGVWK